MHASGFALLAFGVVLFSESTATAQFFPYWRPSPYAPVVPLGGFYTPFGSFSYGQTQALSITKVLPTGQVMSFNYRFTQSGLPLWNPYLFAPVYALPTYTPYAGISGGFNSLNNTTPNPALARMQQDLGNAQRIAEQLAANKSGKGDSYDRWVAERVTPQAHVELNQAVEARMINPPEDEILSGHVLNELALRIDKFEKEGKKASASLCPPDLISKIVFAGGPAADTANSLRTTAPVYPSVLALPALADLRTLLTEAYTPVAAALHSGKKPEPDAIDRLARAVKKARESSEVITKELSVADSSAAAHFFNQLESATRYLKTNPASGLINTKWATAGSNVSELIQHMTKHQLQFGRVMPGDESAYFSLHRGLLTYYAALSQSKK